MTLALDATGNRLVTGGGSEPVLWDLNTYQEVRKFRRHDGRVVSAVFSPSGQQVAFGSQYDPQVLIHNSSSGLLMRTLKCEPGMGVISLAWSPNGEFIATGCGKGGESGAAIIWDAYTGQRRHTLTGFHSGGYFGVDFSRNSKQLLTAAGRCLLWDVDSGKLVRSWDKSLGEYASHKAIFHPVSERLAILSLDEVTTWTTDGEQVGTLRGYVDGVWSVAVRPNGNRFATANDSTVVVWDATSGRRLDVIKALSPKQLSFSDNGYTLAIGCPGELLLRDIGNRSEIRRTKIGHHSFALGPLGKYAYTRLPYNAAARGQEHQVIKIELETGRPQASLHCESYSDIDVSHDGKWLALNDYDLRIYDTTSGKSVEVLHQQEDAKHFSFARGAARAVALGVDPSRQPGEQSRLITVYDTQSWRSICRVRLAHSIHGVKLSADGRTLAVALRDDHSILIFDATTGRPISKLTGHNAFISEMDFRPRTDQLISTSDDGTIRVWDTNRGREVARSLTLPRLTELLHEDDSTSSAHEWESEAETVGREWVTVTPEGYFDASIRAKDLVTWRITNALYPLEQFERRFHRPDILTRALAGRASQDTVSITSNEVPPSVLLKLEETRGEFAIVRAEARPGSSRAKILTVRIAVNGREVPVERLKAVVRERRSDDVLIYQAQVEFPPGRDSALVSAVAIDDLDLESLPARVTIARAKPDDAASGTLHVLAVGISRYEIEEYNLNYAHADAEALAAALQKQKGRAFAEVNARVLTDSDATVSNVKAALSWLQESCRASDVAVVLFSGHGVRGQRGLYYVTHEGDLDALKSTCLNWGEVSAALDKVQAQAVLFLADCCHAGAFGDQSATQDELAESLLRDAGVMVFASSQGHEQSLERADWSHGAFTQALLTGLDGEADLPIGPQGSDGQITVSELQTYVSARVAQMTGQRQHPYIPRLARFDPLLVVALP